MILMVYLASLLGPSDFGMVGMLAIFIALSESLINSGFTQALIQRSKSVSPEDLSTTFVSNIAISITLYLALYFAAPIIAVFFNQNALIEISRVLFSILIINSLSIVPRAILTIRVDFKSQAIAGFFAYLISGVIAVYLAHEGYSYWSLVSMAVSRSFITAALLGYYAKWMPGFNFSKESFSNLFSFGSRLLAAGVIATTLQNLAALLIGRNYGPTDVGLFTQAYNLTNTLSMLISSIFQRVTYPVMTSISNDRPRLLKIYVKIIQLTVVVAFPVFVGFSLVAIEFVDIFLGESWKPIVPLLIILSYARLFTPLSAINMNILNALGRSDLYLRVDMFKVPISVLGMLLAVPVGLETTAYAMVIVSAASFFINAYYPGKILGFGALTQLSFCVRPGVAVAIMASSIFLIEIESPVLSLLAKILIGTVTYVSALFFLRVKIASEILQLLRF